MVDTSRFCVGIGASDILRQFDIPSKVVLPGVGSNLQV